MCPELSDFTNVAKLAPVNNMKKNYIRDQVKLGLVDKLTVAAENIEFCHRIVEEIRRRNYTNLAKISVEYGISLSPLHRVLEIKAQEFLKGDQMPKSCEISVLERMLSSRADEMHLINLTGYKGLSDSDVLELYFLIGHPQLGETEIKRLNELIDTYEMKGLRDYIWDQGLQKFFNARYHSLKGVPEKEMSVKRIGEELTLPAIFDEAQVVKNYVEKKMKRDSGARDIKQELQQENTLKNDADEKLQNVYQMFGEYPCDFSGLREALLELSMDREVARIEEDGISVLRDYIRSKGVIGAHEVAMQYDFVCPVSDSEDLDRARRAISSSFFNQASKSDKGKVFLRKEALYNLHSGVRSAQGFSFSSGYILCIISTEDQGKHFLFGCYPSRREKETFILKCLSCFYLCESYQAAVIRIVRDYIAALAGNIRLNNAIKKILIALPLVVGLGLMIGLLYWIALGERFESLVVGGGILLIGVAIAGKNGYDEEITPASHEKIPDHVNRHHGKVVLGPIQVDAKPAEDENK